MKNLLTVEEYVSLSADKRYVAVREATVDALGGEEVFGEIHRDTGERWIDLAKIWVRIRGDKKDFVLISVLHKIHWGAYPYEIKSVVVEYLLKLVEAELLDGGEGAREWRNWLVFKFCLREILDSDVAYGENHQAIHFIEHRIYRCNRTECVVMHEDVGSAYDEEAQAYHDYEMAVGRMIPTAANWTPEQWADDRNIAAALEALYEVDYSDSAELECDFDRMVCMLMSEKEHGTKHPEFLWYASNISELPVGLVEHLWGDDMEQVVTDTFVAAYEQTELYIDEGEPFKDKKDEYINPVLHFEFSELKRSWLFKLVDKWLHEGKISDVQLGDIRRKVFTLEMNC